MIVDGMPRRGLRGKARRCLPLINDKKEWPLRKVHAVTVMLRQCVAT